MLYAFVAFQTLLLMMLLSTSDSSERFWLRLREMAALH
jgi:hypothetical protein